MKNTIKPEPGIILAKFPTTREQTASGIYIPENTDNSNKHQAIVVAIGDPTKDSTTTVKEGDTVLFGQYGGEKIEFNGETHIFLRFANILAVIVKE